MPIGSLGAGQVRVKVHTYIPRLGSCPFSSSSVPVFALQSTSQPSIACRITLLRQRQISSSSFPPKAKMGTREASHAGSWYKEDPGELSSQLDTFLGQVPAALDEISLPVPGARVIVGP